MNGRVRELTHPQSLSEEEINLGAILNTLWRGSVFILLSAILFGAIFGYYALFIAEKKYTASMEMVLDVRSNAVVDLESVVSGVSTEDEAINTELKIVTSRKILEQLVQDLDLVNDPEFNLRLTEKSALSPSNIKSKVLDLIGLPPDSEPTEQGIRWEVTAAVGEAIAASSTKDTYILNIRATTSDREKSARIVNHLSELYIADQLATKFEVTGYAVEWLSDKVTELEAELKQKEADVRTLQNESDLINAETLEAINIRAKTTRERLEESSREIAAVQMELAALNTAAAEKDIEQIVALTNDPILNRLSRNALAGNEGALDAFETQVETVITQTEIGLKRLASQQGLLEGSLAEAEATLKKQNAELIKLEQMQREAEATRILYETFLARLKETTVQLGLQTPDSRILTEAIPGRKVAPRESLLVALGLALGTVIGAGLVLLKEARRNGFRTVEDLEQSTGCTVMGQIPRIHTNKREKLLGFLRENPSSVFVEAIRNMRTSILMTNVDKPPQVVMFTSSVPAEGKTTISISLANNLAALDKKVLLIEGDIRRQTLNQYFRDAKAGGGLLAVVAGEMELADAVHHQEELGIDVLVGTETNMNAADLISSEKFRNFIETLRAEYDYIIIDTPPVTLVPDARLISPLADATLYCVLWDKTQKWQVQHGLREFTSFGQNVTGVVFSQVDPRGMKRYGYGHYSYYGKSYYNK